MIVTVNINHSQPELNKITTANRV